MPKTAKKSADYILPLYMNGLSGRMLRLPPPKDKKREIMYIYGHHASLERTFGVAQYLNRYGGVTVPDLPGFGGMDSFFKIGEKPSLDNMADYLAAFIKLRYRKQKFDLTGLSLGFMIVTRMLQKHPDLTKQVNILISFAGFAHKDDFRYKKSTFIIFRYCSWFFSLRLPAAFLKYIVFRNFFIRIGYAIFEPLFINNKNTKIRSATDKERRRRIDFEVKLWKSNDVRTYMYIAAIMFRLNLTRKHVDTAVYHVAVDGDRYFNNLSVEQHMREIYKDFHLVRAKMPAHTPSVIATAKEAAPYIPPRLRRILSKKV